VQDEATPLGSMKLSRAGASVAAMANKSSTKEVQRLRTVYELYRASPEKWNPGNAGNAAIATERNEVIVKSLRAGGVWPLRGYRVLDVGCGGGSLLQFFATLGAAPSDLYGIDLLPDRVAVAKESFPGINFCVGNAEEMNFPAEFFDVITLFTVFSSIFSADMRANLVREISRVVRPGGVVLIYDFRVPSLVNWNTRPVSRRAVRRLFGTAPVYAESLTLIPPLARRLGRLTDPWYRRLAVLSPLRTHNLILIRLL